MSSETILMFYDTLFEDFDVYLCCAAYMYQGELKIYCRADAEPKQRIAYVFDLKELKRALIFFEFQ